MKDKEYVLVRNIHTDELLAITKDSWADYKWEVARRNLELVVSGELGYLTMLEQLANEEDGSTEETK